MTNLTPEGIDALESRVNARREYERKLLTHHFSSVPSVKPVDMDELDAATRTSGKEIALIVGSVVVGVVAALLATK